MNETPSVALFDLRFKDSLPPIQSELNNENDLDDGENNKQRGNADGEEEEWIASSHYERLVDRSTFECRLRFKSIK